MNTAGGNLPSAEGAFERFLTAAIAAIITIMFSWRLLTDVSDYDSASCLLAAPPAGLKHLALNGRHESLDGDDDDLSSAEEEEEEEKEGEEKREGRRKKKGKKTPYKATGLGDSKQNELPGRFQTWGQGDRDDLLDYDTCLRIVRQHENKIAKESSTSARLNEQVESTLSCNINNSNNNNSNNNNSKKKTDNNTVAITYGNQGDKTNDRAQKEVKLPANTIYTGDNNTDNSYLQLEQASSSTCASVKWPLDEKETLLQDAYSSIQVINCPPLEVKKKVSSIRGGVTVSVTKANKEAPITSEITTFGHHKNNNNNDQADTNTYWTSPSVVTAMESVPPLQQVSTLPPPTCVQGKSYHLTTTTTITTTITTATTRESVNVDCPSSSSTGTLEKFYGSPMTTTPTPSSSSSSPLSSATSCSPLLSSPGRSTTSSTHLPQQRDPRPKQPPPPPPSRKPSPTSGASSGVINSSNNDNVNRLVTSTNIPPKTAASPSILGRRALSNNNNKASFANRNNPSPATTSTTTTLTAAHPTTTTTSVESRTSSTSSSTGVTPSLPLSRVEGGCNREFRDIIDDENFQNILVPTKDVTSSQQRTMSMSGFGVRGRYHQPRLSSYPQPSHHYDSDSDSESEPESDVFYFYGLEPIEEEDSDDLSTDSDHSVDYEVKGAFPSSISFDEHSRVDVDQLPHKRPPPLPPRTGETHEDITCARIPQLPVRRKGMSAVVATTTLTTCCDVLYSTAATKKSRLNTDRDYNDEDDDYDSSSSSNNSGSSRTTSGSYSVIKVSPSGSLVTDSLSTAVTTRNTIHEPLPGLGTSVDSYADHVSLFTVSDRTGEVITSEESCIDSSFASTTSTSSAAGSISERIESAEVQHGQATAHQREVNNTPDFVSVVTIDPSPVIRPPPFLQKSLSKASTNTSLSSDILTATTTSSNITTSTTTTNTTSTTTDYSEVCAANRDQDEPSIDSNPEISINKPTAKKNQTPNKPVLPPKPKFLGKGVKSGVKTVDGKNSSSRTHRSQPLQKVIVSTANPVNSVPSPGTTVTARPLSMTVGDLSDTSRDLTTYNETALLNLSSPEKSTRVKDDYVKPATRCPLLLSASQYRERSYSDGDVHTENSNIVRGPESHQAPFIEILESMNSSTRDRPISSNDLPDDEFIVANVKVTLLSPLTSQSSPFYAKDSRAIQMYCDAQRSNAAENAPRGFTFSYTEETHMDYSQRNYFMDNDTHESDRINNNNLDTDNSYLTNEDHKSNWTVGHKDDISGENPLAINVSKECDVDNGITNHKVNNNEISDIIDIGNAPQISVDNVTQKSDITTVDNEPQINDNINTHNEPHKSEIINVDNYASKISDIINVSIEPQITEINSSENDTQKGDIININNDPRMFDFNIDNDPKICDTIVNEPEISEIIKVENRPEITNIVTVDNDTQNDDITHVDNETQITGINNVTNEPQVADIINVDNGPKSIEIISVDNEPQITEIVCVDNGPQITKSITVDNEPQITEIISVDNEPQITEIITVDNEPQITEIISVDNGPQITKSITVDNEPQIIEIITVDNEPQITEIISVDNEPQITEIISVDNEPQITEITRVDSQPQIININNVDNNPEVTEIISVDNEPEITEIISVDNEPQITDIISVDNELQITNIINVSNDSITKTGSNGQNNNNNSEIDHVIDDNGMSSDTNTTTMATVISPDKNRITYSPLDINTFSAHILDNGPVILKRELSLNEAETTDTVSSWSPDDDAMDGSGRLEKLFPPQQDLPEGEEEVVSSNVCVLESCTVMRPPPVQRTTKSESTTTSRDALNDSYSSGSENRYPATEDDAALKSNTSVNPKPEEIVSLSVSNGANPVNNQNRKGLGDVGDADTIFNRQLSNLDIDYEMFKMDCLSHSEDYASVYSLNKLEKCSSEGHLGTRPLTADSSAELDYSNNNNNTSGEDFDHSGTLATCRRNLSREEEEEIEDHLTDLDSDRFSPETRIYGTGRHYTSVLQRPLTVHPDQRAEISAGGKAPILRRKINATRNRYFSADNVSEIRTINADNGDPVSSKFARHQKSTVRALKRRDAAKRLQLHIDTSLGPIHGLSASKSLSHLSQVNSRSKLYNFPEPRLPRPSYHEVHPDCILSPSNAEQLEESVRAASIDNLESCISRYGSITSLVETDLDTGETVERHFSFDCDVFENPFSFQRSYFGKSASMMDLHSGQQQQQQQVRHSTGRGRFADRHVPKSKSMQALETNLDDDDEDDLLGESTFRRVPSVHELRVSRSLQKLNVPDWYKKSSVSRSGSCILNRDTDSMRSFDWRYTPSLTSSPASSIISQNAPVVIRTRVTPAYSRSLTTPMKAPKLTLPPKPANVPLPSDKFRTKDKPKGLMPIPIVPFNKIRDMFESKSRQQAEPSSSPSAGTANIKTSPIKITKPEPPKRITPVKRSEHEVTPQPKKSPISQGFSPALRIEEAIEETNEEEEEEEDEIETPDSGRNGVPAAHEFETIKGDTTPDVSSDHIIITNGNSRLSREAARPETEPQSLLIQEGEEYRIIEEAPPMIRKPIARRAVPSEEPLDSSKKESPKVLPKPSSAKQEPVEISRREELAAATPIKTVRVSDRIMQYDLPQTTPEKKEKEKDWKPKLFNFRDSSKQAKAPVKQTPPQPPPRPKLTVPFFRSRKGKSDGASLNHRSPSHSVNDPIASTNPASMSSNNINSNNTNSLSHISSNSSPSICTSHYNRNNTSNEPIASLSNTNQSSCNQTISTPVHHTNTLLISNSPLTNSSIAHINVVSHNNNNNSSSSSSCSSNNNSNNNNNNNNRNSVLDNPDPDKCSSEKNLLFEFLQKPQYDRHIGLPARPTSTEPNQSTLDQPNYDLSFRSPSQHTHRHHDHHQQQPTLGNTRLDSPSSSRSPSTVPFNHHHLLHDQHYPPSTRHSFSSLPSSSVGWTTNQESGPPANLAGAMGYRTGESASTASLSRTDDLAMKEASLDEVLESLLALRN